MEIKLKRYMLNSSLLSTIVGGLIASATAYLVTKKTYDDQVKQAEKTEEQLIKGLLQSIHDEVETVYERYLETMGGKLESLNEMEPLIIIYPLVSDFFSVYNGNSFLIGRISNNDLRKKIIKTYTLAKGMVDSFRLNNDLVNKYEYAYFLYSESQSDVHKNQMSAHYQSLINYASTLKHAHNEFKKEVSSLLRDLRKAGVLNEE